MSLLCVTVRRARLVGNDAQFSTYVTLKLQNVKSTTVTVKGCNPNWEQDFMFETNRMDTGLIIELWNKGLLWDKLIGNHWMPLMGIQFATEVGEGQWLSLDAELELMNGEVCGTHTPTGHTILLEAHFEPPYEFQIDDVGEFSRKLELLNTYMEQEMVAWNHEQRSRYNHANQLYSGLSEDSDYTSDVSYPIQQHPSASSHHPNSSPSQFGGVANLTRHAYDSVDKEYNIRCYDRLSRDDSLDYQNECGVEINKLQNYYSNQSRQLPKPYSDDYEPLSYNSRPPRRTLPQINDKAIHNYPNLMSTQNYKTQSIQSYPNNDMNNDIQNLHYYGNTDYIADGQPDPQSARLARRRQAIRKPSLERQGGFEHFDENFAADHQKQQNKYDGHYTSNSSAKLSEQFYSVDDTFRQDSYESYTNSLGPEPELENEVAFGTNFNQYNNSSEVPQRNNNELSAGFTNWNNETDAGFQNDTQWNWNCDKKEQWKSSSKNDSTLWQTADEDDHFEDSVQHLNNSSKEDKQSLQFFTPKSSIDQSIDVMNGRRESLGRQSTEETIPADEVHTKETDFVPGLPSLISTQTPQHSAIKSENKPSGEPKTVTFSDDIPEKSPPQTNAGTSIISSSMTSSLTSSLSSSVNPEGISRARVRWITAFNKITSDFSEVFQMFGNFVA